MAGESNVDARPGGCSGLGQFAPVNSARDATLLFAKGLAMGLGDSVPGISGGTIAVITNLYDTLIYSIRAIDRIFLGLIFKGRLVSAWQRINGKFLLILALGMLGGLMLSAHTVLYLLEAQFEILMGFFIGLVLASCFLLLYRVRLTQPVQGIGMLAGIGIVLLVGSLEQATFEPSPLSLFFCGAVAICAMILPGLSGAIILILLGAYQYMLTVLIELELVSMVVFMAGCVCGLLLFSRILAWMLHHHHQLSYSLIIGMLLGSMTVLWPWQQVLEVIPDTEDGLRAVHTALLWPLNYTGLTGQSPQIAGVLIALLAGAGLVLGLNKLAQPRVCRT
ncbi:MAG: DUF368 domain-containing protein [Gammaproteobacteria bacterium]|nr:DUF368 domain-containing protein [Gammaproteobacteria bacterium]MCY4357230.1 DUF368 domain-containing protein [Gammaproteobacteria bacterium]